MPDDRPDRPDRPDQSADLRARVLLSVQRALLGAVSPSLRAVTCGWDAESVTVRAAFDGPIEAADEATLSVATTEVAADFPERVELDCLRRDAPASLSPVVLDAWVYRRRADPDA